MVAKKRLYVLLITALAIGFAFIQIGASTPKANAEVRNGIEFAPGGNYNGMELYGFDLSGLNLEGASFVGAIVTEVNFSNSNLTGANFTGARMTSANLSQTNLTAANLTSADVQDVDFRLANLAGIKTGDLGISRFDGALPLGWRFFQGHFVGPTANLTGATWYQGDLRGISLAGANLTSASITGVNMAGVNLTGANLTSASLATTLNGANLTEANLTDAEVGGDAPNVNFTRAIFTRTWLGGLDLTGANLTDADLRFAFIGGIKSSGIVSTSNTLLPEHTRIQKGFLLVKGARLQNADLSSADLSDLLLSSVYLDGANLTGANLSRSRIDGTLGNANFTDADLTSAQISGTLGNANFTRADLTRAYLMGDGGSPNFTDATLMGTSGRGLGSATSLLPSGWVIRGGNLVGPSANLSGAYLRNQNLDDLNLTGANLSFANLTLASLQRANLEGVTLSNANLTGANLSGVRSGSVTCTTATFSGMWGFRNGYLVGSSANLKNAQLAGVDFSDGTIDLIGADFTGADLSGSNFTEVLLRNAILIRANLQGAILSRTDLGGADMSEANLLGVDSVSIQGTPNRLPAGWNLIDGVLAQDKQQTLTPTPTVSGTHRFGEVLTAEPGVWDLDVALTYQWLRNNSPISGSTGQSYSLSLDDIGRKISIEVTGAKQGFLTTARVSAEATISPKLLVNSPRPSISGQFKVGQNLSAQTGNWGADITFRFKWLRDGVPIPNSTSSNYVLVPEDLGRAISVEVIGSKLGYEDATKVSLSQSAQGATLILTPTPTILGKYEIGQTLTANTGAWDKDVTLSFKWLRNGTPIAGADKATYLLLASDNNADITLEVTGSKVGYLPVAKTSLPGKIKLASLVKIGIPKIVGDAKVGKLLTAQPGEWDSGVSFSYKWMRDGQAIDGAATSSLLVTALDFGKSVSVQVTVSLEGFSPELKSSSAVKVAAGILSVVIPKISGVAKSGSTLKVTSSAWIKGAKITYQWLANGAAIKGATAATFKLTTAQKGKKVSVKVTQVAAGYASASSTSAAIAVSK